MAEVQLVPFVLTTPKDRWKTWKTQGPEQQLAEQWTGPYHVLLTKHSSLKLMGIKPWIHHTQLKQAAPERDTDPAAVVDAAKESWTCTLEGDLKFLFQKRTVTPNTGWQCFFYFIHVLVNLRTFSCQILSLSMVLPSVEKNKAWKWMMVKCEWVPVYKKVVKFYTWRKGNLSSWVWLFFICLFSDLMGMWFALCCFGCTGNPLSLLFGQWEIGEVTCETSWREWLCHVGPR